jgi:hypothetical protein
MTPRFAVATGPVARGYVHRRNVSGLAVNCR